MSQKIRCDDCKKESEIFLLTEPLSFPFELVMRVYLECPHCHYQKTSYFLSPALAQKQLELNKEVDLWQSHKNRLNFNRVVIARKEYTELFDSEQQKYREFLDLEKVGDDGG